MAVAPRPRRGLWIWIGAGVAATLVLCVLAFVIFRKPSRFEFLYAEHPILGELAGGAKLSSRMPYLWVSISGAPGGRMALSPTAAPSTPQTVMIFPNAKRSEIEALIAKRFSSEKFTLFRAIPVAKAPGTFERETVWVRAGTSERVSVVEGESAEILAKDAHLKLPPDSFAVVVSEAPDWLSVRIAAVLRFLGIR